MLPSIQPQSFLKWTRTSFEQSLKQPEDIFQEEWYKIALETVKNLYEPIPKRIATVLKAKAGPTPY
jgi:hypothetical protein